MRAKRELTQIIFLFLVFLVLIALRPVGDASGGMTPPLGTTPVTLGSDAGHPAD